MIFMKAPSTTSVSPSIGSATATAPPALRLRLWLPGHHTPSLNRTAAQHWGKVRRLKKADAAALYEALRENGRDNPCPWPVREVLEEARRVLVKLLLGVELEKKRGKKPPKPERPAYVRIERVTVSLLDEDNFKGGAKGLLDCLKAAFPTIILDDAPGYLVADYVQTRCASKCEQGTWVEVVPEFPQWAEVAR